MNTQSMSIQSSDAGRVPESGTRRRRVRRRSAASLTARQSHAAPPAGAPVDGPGATRQPSGARILRRWSVADLIARAASAPGAIA
jgi:hypothetical protein